MLLSGHSQYDDYGWLVSTRPVPLCVTRYELEAILRSFDCFLSCLLRRSGFCPNQSFIASYPSMNLLFTRWGKSLTRDRLRGVKGPTWPILLVEKTSCLGSVIVSEFEFLNQHVGTDGRPPYIIAWPKNKTFSFIFRSLTRWLPNQLDLSPLLGQVAKMIYFT